MRSLVAVLVLLPIGCFIFLVATLSLALFHEQLWHVSLAMVLGGTGSGFTFSSLAVLMLPHVPSGETGSAMAFNQVLRSAPLCWIGCLGAVPLVGGETGREVLKIPLPGVVVRSASMCFNRVLLTLVGQVLGEDDESALCARRESVTGIADHMRLDNQTHRS